MAVLPRAGIVHRLDKDTSGVMVVARTLEAQTALVGSWRHVTSVPGHRDGRAGGRWYCRCPIDRHPRDRLKMAVREDGKKR